MKENFISINAQISAQLDCFNEFNNIIEQEIRALFAQVNSDNCWPEMYLLVRDTTLSFCDSNFLLDQSSFIFALLHLYPELMTTYVEPTQLTPNPDNETSPYDFLCDIFLDVKLSEAMEIGLELGVFTENNGIINLTPKFNVSSLEVH